MKKRRNSEFGTEDERRIIEWKSYIFPIILLTFLLLLFPLIYPFKIELTEGISEIVFLCDLLLFLSFDWGKILVPEHNQNGFGRIK